jgi:LacI family transcriptional regulator
MNDKTLHVALALPDSVPTQFLAGFGAYQRDNALTWEFVPGLQEYVWELSSRELRKFHCDGIVASISNPDRVRRARRMKTPVVNIEFTRDNHGLPRPIVDQEAVGRLAGEHLRERGFMRFACYSLQGRWYAERRKAGFESIVCDDAAEYSVLDRADEYHPWPRLRKWLTDWLRTLRPPVAMFATNDMRASEALRACRDLGLRVPEDVAICGADNQMVVCELSNPPLSSVAYDNHKVGYEAASLLDRMMAGEKLKGDFPIQPDHVAGRKSTDTVAVENPEAAAAIEYMRHHYCEPITVEEVLNRVSLSRRWLEHAVKQSFGVTPREYLCRLRLQQAQKLLAGPKTMKLGEVARSCGFGDTERMNRVFRNLTGQTARQYRDGAESSDE